MTTWATLGTSDLYASADLRSYPTDAIALNGSQSIFGITDYSLGSFGKMRLFCVTVNGSSLSVSTLPFSTPGGYDNSFSQSLARLDGSRFAVAWASDLTTPATHYVTEFLVAGDGTITEGDTETTSTTVETSNSNGSQAMVAVPAVEGVVVIQDADLGSGYYAHFRAAKHDGTGWTLGPRSQVPIASPVINIDAALVGVSAGFYFGVSDQHIAATVDPASLAITWGGAVSTTWRTDSAAGLRSVNATAISGTLLVGADAPTFGDSSTTGAALAAIDGTDLSFSDYQQKPTSNLRGVIPSYDYGPATYGSTALLFNTYASGLPPEVWSFGWTFQSAVADYPTSLLDSAGHMFVALDSRRFIGAVNNHAPTYEGVTFVLIGTSTVPPLRQNQRDDIRQGQRTSRQLTVRQVGYL